MFIDYSNTRDSVLIFYYDFFLLMIVPRVDQVLSVPYYHLDNGFRQLIVNFSTVVI